MDHEKEELIRRRAYAIWEQEGRPEGEHHRHWEQASREMQGQHDGSGDGAEKDRSEPAAEAVRTPSRGRNGNSARANRLAGQG